MLQNIYLFVTDDDNLSQYEIMFQKGLLGFGDLILGLLPHF